MQSIKSKLSRADFQLIQRMIGEMIKREFANLQQHTGKVKDRILTRKEAAAKINRHLSTLWRLRHKLKPRRRKSDGAPYYLESDVNKYLELNED